MPASLFLQRKFNDYMRQRVVVAFDLTEELVKADPLVPRDTRNLESRITFVNRLVAAPRYRGIITSQAFGDGGADYAAILEAAPRIAPRTRQFLRFEVGGEEVFSKGFNNVHYQWWTNLWRRSPSPWRRALEQSGALVAY